MVVRSSVLVLVALGAPLLSSCSCDGSDSAGASTAGTTFATSSGSGGAPAYDAVTIEPPQASLEVELGGTATQDYQVFAVIAGKKTEVTTDCELSVDSAFGGFNGATLQVLPHGGKTTVTATCGAAAADSDLTVLLKGDVFGTPDTPTDAPDLFDAATDAADPAKAPKVEYPIDKAIAPRNIPPMEMQWAAPAGDLFHVGLTSGYVAVDVYTTSVEATLSGTDWTAIMDSAAGESLAIEVESLVQATPATKDVSEPVELRVSHDSIDKTAIYYWASSQGNLMTQMFGNTGAPTALKPDCTSCHSVSRAGTRIGYSRCVGGDCGQLFAGFMRYDPTTKAWIDTVDANAKAIAGSYTTFAPVGNPFPGDEQSVALVTLKAAHLELYDPDTGAVVPSNVADVSTHGPGAPRSALMPDWSPDGATVVFASTPNGSQYIDLSGSAIATMPYAMTGGQHVFGEPSLIVSGPLSLAGGDYDNLFFPSWSPDGALVVFDAARAAWRNFSDAKTPGQRLVLTDAKGSWTAELAAANGEGDLDVTWPHWAPGQATDYYWVVFSSERDYGHRVTAANTNASCVANGVHQCKQLWIAAIDKSAAAVGGPTSDPSAPPVWLPGQDIAADNISPYWTVPAQVVPR